MIYKIIITLIFCLLIAGCDSINFTPNIECNNLAEQVIPKNITFQLKTFKNVIPTNDSFINIGIAYFNNKHFYKGLFYKGYLVGQNPNYYYQSGFNTVYGKNIHNKKIIIYEDCYNCFVFHETIYDKNGIILGSNDLYIKLIIEANNDIKIVDREKYWNNEYKYTFEQSFHVVDYEILRCNYVGKNIKINENNTKI